MMLKVTTESGAVYYIADDGVVIGGSLELTDGRLCSLPTVEKRLLIYTPERAKQNPTIKIPGVASSRVISIEVIDDTKRT